MINFLVNNFLTPYILLILGFNPVFSYSSGPILGEENCQPASLPISVEKVEPEIMADFPVVNSVSAAVLAIEPNFWLFNQTATEARSIASITKLMTALVFLETEPDWLKEYTIINEDIVSGGRINLFLGDTVNIIDLFYTALIASDNGAATALVRSTGLSEDQFVYMMNEKAQELSLFATQFVDVTGLSNENISNAKDVARLAKVALKNQTIKEALSLDEHQFTTKQGRDKIISSTANGLLNNSDKDFLISLGKTGYTEKAGFCFVGLYINEEGKEIISVILGANSRQDRFLEANLLANWAFTNCDW
jgi:serine-type D-Ala-D-Ala endopeptidase (penicillin-binding protein 7)